MAFGFKTLNLKLCELELWELTVARSGAEVTFGRGDLTVSFHNFKSQNFKLSVSNPKSKYVVYLSVLSQISNCQGLGRKNKHENLKTDRSVCPLEGLAGAREHLISNWRGVPRGPRRDKHLRALLLRDTSVFQWLTAVLASTIKSHHDIIMINILHDIIL